MGSIDPNSRGAVLVVDDDVYLRAEIRDVLEAERYFVLEAGDGIYALEALGSTVGSAVRLVILDLMMPFMTGWELVDFFRRDPRFAHLSMLVMTGLSVHGDASGVGATTAWIRKPFGAEELVAVVNQLLGHELESDPEPSMPQETGRTSRPSHHEPSPPVTTTYQARVSRKR
jgi:CheY-like chemotaxis protein